MIHLRFHCGCCGGDCVCKLGLVPDAWTIACPICDWWAILEPTADLPLATSHLPLATEEPKREPNANT
jgi:hypothetical protein